MRAPAEAACGDYDVYVPGMTFIPTLVALPTAQLVVTQPYDTHVSHDSDVLFKILKLQHLHCYSEHMDAASTC